MALTDEVTTRLSTERLVALTNPDNVTSIIAPGARLTAAGADTEAEFRYYTGVIYDNSNALHVALAVDGVVIFLQKFMDNENINEAYQDWIRRLERFRISEGGNQRILPDSTSELTPADERPDSAEVRPHFDVHESFESIRPETPI